LAPAERRGFFMTITHKFSLALNLYLLSVMTNNYKPFYLLLFILALLVSFVGITTDFFTDDPGLVRAIAKSML
jgi:hypothetical protein